VAQDSPSTSTTNWTSTSTGATDRNKRRRPTTATPQEIPNRTPDPERVPGPVADEEPVAVPVPTAVDPEPSRFARIEAGRPGYERSRWFDYDGVFPAGVVVLPPWLTEEDSELACTSLSLVYIVPLECADV